AELARVTEGSVALPSPTVQTEYTFTARNDRGASVSRLFTVRPVGLPVINTFTLTPTITNLGDAATARWTTTDAVRVQLRQENGPNLLVVTTASQVASGNVGLLLASSTRIVLEATNAAGDSVSETRAFTFTGAVTLTPNPVLRGSPATLTWDLAAANVTEVVGLPTTMPAVIGGSNNFVDLVTSPTANELVIADIADGAEKLTLPAGFRFPLLGVVQNDLWVSVNGFIATANPGPNNVNADLSGTNTAPTLIAPFWDDLSMTANSKVFVDTSTSVLGERFLIVQWEQLQIAGQQTSELTFQVHLYETGQIAFVYKTTNGMLNSATIGVQDRSWPVAQQYAFDSMTTIPTPGMELNFFSGGPAAGMLTFNAGPSRQVSFTGRTTMSRVGATAELRSFGPGDVQITEVMPLPEMSVLTTGQWLELRNTQAQTTDLEGLVVTTPGSLDGGFTFPPGSFVDAGAFIVIGQSTDPGLNGGAPVAFASDDVPLAAPGSATISLAGTPLSTLAWDAGTAAQSIAPVTPVLVASGTFTCPRTATFGPGGALGTPGGANENCSPYVMSSIPGNFITAPMGSEIGTSLSGDEGYTQITLPVPFRYYGQTYADFSFSMNGFITLGAPLAANQFTSPTTVSATVPNGVVSPLWDDLHRDTGKAAMFRLSDRTVISWQTFNTYEAFFWAEPSDLNFQVHLIDSGAIEFHYGTMSTTSLDAFVIAQTRGATATCWLETPMGDRAVPYSVHLNGIVQPNSGVRFTPAP
ncbi:MAG: lamin tail domain-containing protein, partial [Archangium sp.]|nr:lamin tail domain-containing protein [Archangium sp.]